MAMLTQLSNSFLSATNQNTLALANLNLDFSLIKVCPPKEYEGLGLALSQNHRENAEDGQAHRTVRRLGALFEPVIPSIPNLTQVYGQRVSEIANSKRFTSKNDAGYGPFQKHVGLDATSIYAAATSGSKVIALHLLACMLARSWSGPEAIAIWVELVEERRREIEAKSNPNEPRGMLARATAQQEITRAHLAGWDASARAWLRSADEVKKFEQTQLRLIIKDSGLPVSSAGTTYASVIEAWTMAMTSLQKLIIGNPQNISKGSVLLGLLSWHIYPDLNVVEPTANIQFKDPLVQKGGVVTLGLQRKDSIGSGVHWSLALSHLRFYGDPVPVERSIASDNGHLTLPELHLVALGSVISSWSEPEEVDVLEVADCFVALGECLSNNIESQEIEGLDSDLHWLHLLVKAAGGLLVSNGMDREHRLGLVEYCRRRGRAFLDADLRDRVPMFGLANPLQIFHVSDEIGQHKNDIQSRLAVLRRLAKKCQFDPLDCIIRYNPVTRPNSEYSDGTQIHEYATAVEIPRASKKRGRDDQIRGESGHLHWTYIDTGASVVGNVVMPLPQDGQVSPGFGDSFHMKCSCLPQCLQDCPCRKREHYCSSLCAGYQGEEAQEYAKIGNTKPGWISNLYHHQRVIFNPKSLQYGHLREFDTVLFRPAPPLFVKRYNYMFQQSYLAFCEEHYCAEADGPEFVNYRFLAGDFVLSLLLSSLAPIHVPSLSISELTRTLRSGSISGFQLIEHLSFLSRDGPVSETVNRSAKASHGTFLVSLQAMAAATELYSEWPEATVSIEITRCSLGLAHWASSFHENGSWGTRNTPRRSQLKNRPPISQEEPDPSETSWSSSPAFRGIRRILGSLDRPGIVLLVPPQAPRILEIDLSSWRFAQQTAFDGSSRDLFKQTSLHLTFTEYEIPLGVARSGRDAEAVMLETLVSAHDGRRWVADLDILGSLAALAEDTRAFDVCRHRHVPSDSLGRMLATWRGLKLKSIESWDDLLCCDDNLIGREIGVVRSYNNPYSRLAAAAVCVRKGYSVRVLPSHLICPDCSSGPSIASVIEKLAQGSDGGHRAQVLIA